MAYTEFYAQSGGSNLNAGSTNGAVTATQTGDWVNATKIFTPNDGTNPVSLGIAVGMFASVYVTAGATVATYIARISAVTNATNGATTCDLVPMGTNPANSSGGHTITMKVGGAWLGPNAATGFPTGLTSFANGIDSTSHPFRLNLKNDQTYTMTASFAVTPGTGYTINGYTSTVNDGGRATFDGTTNTGAIISATGSGVAATYNNIIFKTSISSGTTVDLVIANSSSNRFVNCVFTGARRYGLSLTGIGYVIECESYNNNTNNNSPGAGFIAGTNGTLFYRCISHDNTGSNTAGLTFANTSNIHVVNCVFDTNGGNGIGITGISGQLNSVGNDFYNNTGDAINIVTANTLPHWIENCNFFKNLSGINNVSVVNSGFVYNNTYGAGTQANTNADTLGNLISSGATTYTSNLTPWVDPANGNFSQPFNTAIVGRGVFVETATSYAGTVGYPNTGAAQASTPVKSGGFS